MQQREHGAIEPAAARPRGIVLQLLGVALLALWLAGCATGPRPSGSGAGAGPAIFPERDGPEANPPPDLARVPDAEPKLEPIRSGGPNKPYELLGKNYVPITQDAPFTERGLASWYGRKFHGRRTASGEVYNMYAMTAAHPTLPIPSYARIRNPSNGREIVVRINDRGPFHSSRIVDLSYTAALKLDLLRGVAPVELQRITFDEIRTGAWRRGKEADPVLAARPVDEVRPASPPVPQPMPEPVVATGPTPTPTPTSTLTPTPTSTPAPAPAPTASAPLVEPTVAAAPAAPAAQPPVADAPSARAFTLPARGFWVQLGAFRARDGAEGFQRQVAAELNWLSPLLAVFDDAPMFRLQAGPYPRRDEARSVAERVRGTLQLVPVIVERR